MDTVYNHANKQHKMSLYGSYHKHNSSMEMTNYSPIGFDVYT